MTISRHLSTALGFVAIVCAGACGKGSSTEVPPNITTEPSAQTVDVGHTATFAVVATGTEPLRYQWTNKGAAIAGAISSSYTTPGVTLADDGAIFAVVVSNGAGSVTSAEAALTVLATPVFTSQPTSQTVAAGATVTFLAAASGNPTT